MHWGVKGAIAASEINAVLYKSRGKASQMEQELLSFLKSDDDEDGVELLKWPLIVQSTFERLPFLFSPTVHFKMLLPFPILL